MYNIYIYNTYKYICVCIYIYIYIYILSYYIKECRKYEQYGNYVNKKKLIETNRNILKSIERYRKQTDNMEIYGNLYNHLITKYKNRELCSRIQQTSSHLGQACSHLQQAELVLVSHPQSRPHPPNELRFKNIEIDI